MIEFSDVGVRFVTPLWGERRYVWENVLSIEAVRGTLFAPLTQFVFRIEGGDEIWVGPFWPPGFRRLLSRCTPPGCYRRDVR